MSFQPSNYNDLNKNFLVQGNRNIQDVFVKDFKKGEINPIERQTIKRVVTVDSLFRDNYNGTSGSDFTHTFREPFNNVVSMKISNLEIPNIWYFFSSSARDNEFYITTKNAKSITGEELPDKTHKVVIPEGNYSYDAFRVAMNNILYNVDNDNTALRALVVALDTTTGRVVIRANKNTSNGRPTPYVEGFASYSPDFEFTVDFNIPDLKRDIKQNMGWKMGFRKDKYRVTRDQSFTDYRSQELTVKYDGYLTGEGIYGSSINRYIYIVVDDFQNNYHTSIYGDSKEYLTEDSILGRIPVTAISNAILVNTPGDMIFKERVYFGPVKLDKLRFKLLDRFGNTLNLNNNDYSIALEITQMYS